jgi:hypothetical protein
MIPNKKQKRKYDLFSKRVNSASNQLYGCALLEKNATTAIDFGERYKISVPALMFVPGWRRELLQLSKENKHWLRLLRGMEDHRLYFVDRPDDDFDIGLPPGATGDEVANWRFGAVPIIAVVAIVVATAALARSLYVEYQAIKIKKKLKDAVDTADKLFLKTDPATARMWQNHKQDGEWDKNNEIAGIIPQIEETVSSGLKWGVAIGIPVLIFLITQALTRER